MVGVRGGEAVESSIALAILSRMIVVGGEIPTSALSCADESADAHDT